MNNIKKGIYIQCNGNIYKVIDFLHVKPGKGYPFIRTKLKNVITENILEYNFSSKHQLKIAKINSYFYKYLYKDKFFFYFMNDHTYDQIQIEKKLIKNIKFLKEGTKVCLFFHIIDNEKKDFLFLKMPTTVILKVKFTENMKKGDTINNTNKIAILETGTKLLVPSFINIGDLLKINTENESYIERIR
ncbi:elongation factor P [Blattabacterium cuenoti]|uniref:elongation factor P n=1 Tax=Blattabacterium cuenoti TaxID=1653831 RepID=UPI00163CBB2D|nr:elongation factor P [Blattabacterium cuenoti]